MTKGADGLFIEWSSSLKKRYHFGAKWIKKFFWLKKKKVESVGSFGPTAGSTGPIPVQPLAGSIGRTKPKPWPSGPVFKTMK